ncbi:hypothetical protein GCM10011519_21870 [Marmoricola endophyticus]|uniref:non-specific serine/threonine protein kinase n=1 Tax=Marmoricola endophyticus TaxID=2040280 RepID=A0A917F2U2_9ACTN|nr:protein kinase [Marmoricola endophyticus]GGF47440.1 hypothetical protein GCM10011519_21870 [Marmoricola endophyticus]
MSRYEFTERIATGGMGEIWRGRDTVLNRDVAIKVLKPEMAGDARFRERFANEARNAASLQHPHIASVYDYGETDDASGPRPYLIMELVDGRPLSDLIQPGRPMPADRARLVVRQAAEALAAAHAAGIVHRDVKPANLLVRPDGTVKVTDFGIARAVDAASLTSTGEVLGTPHYLAPEQAEGKPSTSASDVYSLGVVLFECLTGNRPFSGDNAVGVAMAHLRTPAPPLPDSVPEDLRTVVETAMAKDPSARYADASAMAIALGASPGALHQQAGTPAAAVAPDPATEVIPEASPATEVMPRTQATPAPVPVAAAEPPRKTEAELQREADDRRAKAWYAVAAVLLVALIVGGIALFLSGGGDDPSDSPSTVEIVSGDYIGLSEGEARDKLEDLGFTDIQTTDQSNPGGRTEGNVAGISPRGNVSTDQTITLRLWGEEPQDEPTQQDTPTRDPEPSQTPTQEDTPTQEPSDTPSTSPSTGGGSGGASAPSSAPTGNGSGR